MKWRITESHYLTVEFKSPNDQQLVTYGVLFEATGESPIEIGTGCKYNYRGPPTPNMEPLDEEARRAKDKYTAEQAKRLAVINPIEALPLHG